jgi:hypothetical protein
VGIKPFQYVNLIITVMTALFTGVLTLWKVSQDQKRSMMEGLTFLLW